MRRWTVAAGAASVVVLADYLLVLTDSVIAGRVLGEMALGAFNLLMPVSSAVLFVLWLVVSGTTKACLKARSKGRLEFAARLAGTGFAATLALGVLLALAILALKGPYLALLSPGAELETLAANYWTWFPVVIFFAAIELILFSFVYIEGEWMTCLIAYAVLTGVNLVASYRLVGRIGLEGLSLGSALAILASLAVLLPKALSRKKRILAFRGFEPTVLLRACRNEFAESFVWLFHAVVFFVVLKYVLVVWDAESVAVTAVIFCIIRLTCFFSGIGFVLKSRQERDTFFGVASGLSFMILALSTVVFVVAPEPLVGLFGIEDFELMAGARFAARLTVGGLLISTAVVFLPLRRRARLITRPQAEPNYLQQYILVRMAESPGSQMFNLVKLFKLRKGVDLERLSSALVASAQTHAALLTCLRRDDDGEVVQRQELAPSAVTCPVVRGVERDLLTDRASLVTEFGMFGKRLFNARIYDCGDTAYLLSDFHHLICDGYSFPLILNGARTIYEGGTLANDTYYDVLAKRKERAAAPLAEAARAMMRELFKDPKFTTLPPDDFARPGGFGAYETAIVLPEDFDAFLSAHRVTRHHVFLAATVLALGRLTGANDLLIDWVFHGRISKEELRTVGAFMVDLPLVIENRSELTAADVLSRVKMATFNGIRQVAAIRAIEDVNPDGRDRLTFIYQDEWGELMTSGPVRPDGPYGWMIDETIPVAAPAARPENPFNVEIMEHADSTRLFIEYDSGRYSPATVSRYADLFMSVLSEVLG